MFKLHRHRSGKTREKIDFRFSRFRASQVPKGWDRLFISIISAESGKTIAKSSKALVHDGSCLWTESLTECIFLFQDDATKELEECIYKFVVSMGSARSSVLGEATLNLADHTSPKNAVPVSLPLMKCSYETNLQFNVQCLTPGTKSRNGRHWKETSNHDDLNIDNDDLDNKSDESDIMLNRSVGSSSSNHLVGSPHPDEPGSKDMNFSASGSHHSSDSGDSFISRTNFSPRNSLNGTHNQIGRQDSAGSQGSSAYGDDISRSNSSSFNSRAAGSGALPPSNWQDRNADSHAGLFRHSDSSKELLEAAQETIEELRGEARLWERNARKLKTDLDALRKEFSEQSRQQADMDMQLQTTCMERDNLKLEIEQLKSSMDELLAKQTTSHSTLQADDQIHKQKELEDELRFLKDSNTSLSLQLQKTQEANIELVSILQELEETIEEQRLEIANFSEQSPKDAPNKRTGGHNFLDIEPVVVHKMQEEDMIHSVKELPELQDPGYSVNNGPSSGSDNDLIKEIDTLKIKIQELERDCAELTEENLELMLKMKESKKDTIGDDNSLGYPPDNIQSVNRSEARLSCTPEAFLGKLSSIDPGPKFLQSMPKMYQLAEELVDGEVQSRFMTEPFVTQFKELEKKCADLELQAFKDKASSLDTKFCDSQKEVEQKSLELCEMRKKLKAYQEVGVQDSCSLPGIKPEYDETDDSTEISMFSPEEMRATILLKEGEINILRHSKKGIEDLLCSVQSANKKLEEDLEVALKEGNMASKCLDDMRKEMMVLTSSMDSQISANKFLERKSLELESGKHELEIHTMELEQENVELSERISGLEAQLRYLTNDKQSSRLELENSKSLVTGLKDELEKLRTEMENQKVDLRQKLQETQRRLSDATEESEYLKRSHSKLQATVESLIDECSSLQKLTSDLKRQKLELHERSTLLEVELSESQKRNSDFCNKIETLEDKLSLLQKGITLKEKSFFSEVEAMLQKQKEQEEKLQQANVLLNQITAEKEAELENLQQEVSHLTSQSSSTDDDTEKIASDAVREAYKLRADKIKLENNLQETQAKAKSYEMQIYTLKQESDDNIQGLIGLLDASKQSEEMLMADIEHMKRNMDNVKLSEEKVKKISNELELKLKSSEYEREQLSEEVSSMKAQLMKMANLQVEITTLKSYIDETKFEKVRLEESLLLLSEECKKLKTEHSSYTEKISMMQKSLSDVEGDRRSRVALEEKLLRLECDLNARDALYAQDIELKNELNRIKRTNSQYQRNIQCLEEERKEFTRKIQVLEKDSCTRKAEIQDGNQVLPEGDKSLLSMDDLESKVRSLETELAEALETNNTYKLQLESFALERQATNFSASKSAMVEDSRVEGNDDRLTSFEAELKDMRERYLQMSLKYAEVEAQREDLVMKLKSVKKEKRWFS